MASQFSFLVLHTVLLTYLSSTLAMYSEGYFRLEVLFTHFDNTDGKIFNGKRCDAMTACDPIIYAYIDLEEPAAPYPGKAKRLRDFQQLVSETGKNVIIMNAKMVKDMCIPVLLHQQKAVAVRAEVRDRDYFTPDDLIDEFDCRFNFIPKPGSLLESATGTWSSVQSCQAINRPNKISLSFRWRAYPIMASDCGYTVV
ncbi:hypothetical protein BV898_03260 [Hypsibius exemplaris]|uniref:Uncharacterized protein n=1 Tax=Hypsibius exemplaris TaxID=2072580 RepID=A0A1W0X5K6_HYPEX|nr:hypothetical protein BV898_03260 [Hypsibius exemplaris]